MPLISNHIETKKDRLVRKLRGLPDDILEKVYHLDIIQLKGKMEWDSWLADRYRKFRVLSPDKGWLRIEIEGWSILIETE